VPGLYRTCRIVGIPSPGPRAMVGSKEEANESQSFAAACYLLVRSQSVWGRHAAQTSSHWAAKHARSQGFNETSERHGGGYAHLCPLEDLRATNIEI
jgi:hypothetical protein